MAITTRDQLIAAIAVGPGLDFLKASVSTQAGGRWANLFRAAGRPTAAASPAAGAAGNACSSATPGALGFANPTATANTYLAGFAVNAQQPGVVLLYDRLVETANLNGTVVTAQAVGSVPLPPRATGGVNVELWLEVHTALGATASSTVTASYTNQAGVAGRTATLLGGIQGTSVAGNMYPFALQAGDTGVRTVESVTSTTSTGTAGSFGVTLIKRLAQATVVSNNIGAEQGWPTTGLAEIPDDACLALMMASSTASTGNVVGSARIAQG